MRAAPSPAPGVRTIVLVRHGDYVENAPVADPRFGPHLTPLGVAQARLARAALLRMPVHFDHVYASPMHRARDTAVVIAAGFPQQPLRIVDDLAECTPPTRATSGRDNIACQRRLDRVFARFFKPAQAGDQADMLVCHGNVIRYLVARARGADPAAWAEMSVGNASLTIIRIDTGGHFTVDAVGDIAHLPLNMRTGAHGDAERNLAHPWIPEPR